MITACVGLRYVKLIVEQREPIILNQIVVAPDRVALSRRTFFIFALAISMEVRDDKFASPNSARISAENRAIPSS
jgi:hypothetical protein